MVELDWTAYFDRSTQRVPDQQIWDRVLFPDLVHAREVLGGHSGGAYFRYVEGLRYNRR